MDVVQLFMGWEPDAIFRDLFGWMIDGKTPFSVDFSELLLVFGTIAGSMAVMVWFGNWWQN